MNRLSRSEVSDGLAAFCFPEGETLLGSLCYHAKRQGGTIHQFFPQGVTSDVAAMRDAFVELRRCGITFNSRAALDKLAAQYHLAINWQ